jgi:hypothetical protein
MFSNIALLALPILNRESGFMQSLEGLRMQVEVLLMWGIFRLSQETFRPGG